MIATLPPNTNVNAQYGTVQQADARANNTLQNQFPGWRLSDSQRGSDGHMHKAHIKDDAGHEKTVWFDGNDRVVRQADGEQ